MIFLTILSAFSEVVYVRKFSEHPFCFIVDTVQKCFSRKHKKQKMSSIFKGRFVEA